MEKLIEIALEYKKILNNLLHENPEDLNIKREIERVDIAIFQVRSEEETRNPFGFKF